MFNKMIIIMQDNNIPFRQGVRYLILADKAPGERELAVSGNFIQGRFTVVNEVHDS